MNTGVLLRATRGLAARLWTFSDDSSRGRLHRAARSREPDPPVALFCVYRFRNAKVVRALVDAMPPGSTALLHALDEESTLLGSWTASSGPGHRMPLLDGLIRQAPPRPDQFVLLADDDALLAGQGLPGLLRVARAAGLDLAMPAHGAGSEWTFRVTRRRSFSSVRRTSFVEVGPLLLLSARAFARIHPFPESARMGWGLDVRWSTLSNEGFRLGVVDAVPMRHLGAVATAYDRSHEEAELARHSAEAGVSSAYDLARETGAVMRPWSRTPPWPTDTPRAAGVVDA